MLGLPFQPRRKYCQRLTSTSVYICSRQGVSEITETPPRADYAVIYLYYSKLWSSSTHQPFPRVTIWVRRLALLAGLIAIAVFVFAPPPADSGDDAPGFPLIAITASRAANGLNSTSGNQSRELAQISDALVGSVSAVESGNNESQRGHHDGRSILNSSCSLRC